MAEANSVANMNVRSPQRLNMPFDIPGVPLALNVTSITLVCILFSSLRITGRQNPAFAYHPAASRMKAAAPPRRFLALRPTGARGNASGPRQI
jgi:hypothetical protein